MTIEYENNDILIINKPAGTPVYSTKVKVQEESVLSWFLEKYPAAKSVGDPERPGIVHRLDKQTSGLLALAKTQTGFEYLSKLFRSRTISKEYIALVYGHVAKHGIIEKPLTKIGQEGRSKVRVDEKGKAAKTEYWAEKYYEKELPPTPSLIKEGELPSLLQREGRGELGLDQYTLVRIKLHTGRTHQIRVHFASEDHPVMGDDLYGTPDAQKLAGILTRQFLHASKLEFKLPDSTWLEIESELPEDLKEVLSELSS